MSDTFTDRYGTALQIGGEASFAGCARLTVSKLCGIHVYAADFPALIAALYEAAELPAPVILERPEIDPEGAAGINVFTVRLDRDLSVCVAGRAGHASPVAPSVARKLASVIAAYADAAEAAREFDPAEVEELAELLREHGDCASLRWDAARAVLRWFRERRSTDG